MSKDYAPDARADGEKDAGTNRKASSARETFTVTYHDENEFLEGTLTLAVEVEDGKVVKLRARDSSGQDYEILFRPVTSAPGRPRDDEDDDKDKDKDDKEECVKCTAAGCVPVKCRR